ncbi:hypothetical protein EUAN_09120 [Andreesenia angusta]|uniref:DUF1828 domain-containing protein n=1 Tax=Andreesenia angusta TaxID=39480 RepID=A0A1S1V962_9FIRM|nr:DUF1828 domain-containing protein [Andreesenia angusta]OHW63128.1 hypothetical protein EUAN_09120 [Andreesenia angusta]
MTNTFSDIYIKWIKENIEEKQISENIFRITTPFLDRNNDHIEVYVVKESNGSLTITDDGNTLGELALSGFSIQGSPKRKHALETILKSHGVSMGDDGDLFVEANMSNFPSKKHMLTQCMIKVSDLFVLSHSSVKSFFLEDVRNFFENNDIRYTEGPSFVGKSKLVNNYDFVIPHYKKAPERIVRVINDLRPDYARSIMFSWDDIKDVRPNNSVLYTFVNDQDKKPSKDALQALSEYDIKYVLWSERNNSINELSA